MESVTPRGPSRFARRLASAIHLGQYGDELQHTAPLTPSRIRPLSLARRLSREPRERAGTSQSPTRLRSSREEAIVGVAGSPSPDLAVAPPSPRRAKWVVPSSLALGHSGASSPRLMPSSPPLSSRGAARPPTRKTMAAVATMRDALAAGAQPEAGDAE